MENTAAVECCDASTCGNSTLGDEEINHAAYDQLLQQITSNWVQREEQFKSCVDRLQSELDNRGKALQERDDAIAELTQALEASKRTVTENTTAAAVPNKEEEKNKLTPTSGAGSSEPLDAKTCESDEEDDPSAHNGGLAYLDCSYEDCRLALKEYCTHTQKKAKNAPAGFDISVVEAICDYALNEALELCHLQVCKAAVDKVGCTISIQVWHDCVVRPLQDASELIAVEGATLEAVVEKLEGLIKGFHDGYREAAVEEKNTRSGAQLLLFPSYMKMVNNTQRILQPTRSRADLATARGSPDASVVKTPSSGTSAAEKKIEETIIVEEKNEKKVVVTAPENTEESVERMGDDNERSPAKPDISVDSATFRSDDYDGNDNNVEIEPPVRQQVVSPVKECSTDSANISNALLKLPNGFQASGSFNDSSYSTHEAHVEADRASAPPLAPPMEMFSPKSSVRQSLPNQRPSTARNESSEGNYGDFSTIVGGGGSPAQPTPIKPLRPHPAQLDSPNPSGGLSSSDGGGSRNSALGVPQIQSLGSSYSTAAPPLSPRSREDIERRREETFRGMK